MKWTFIVVNLLVACVFHILGEVAAGAHHVHAHSTYKEFLEVGAVDEQKLKTLTVQGTPTTVGYDMEARLRQIGNAEANFLFLGNLAATACVVNAIGIFVLARKRKNNF